MNGTLNEDERAVVDAWLARHPHARAEVDALRHLHRAMRARPPHRPPDHVWARIQAHLPTALRPWPRWLTWAWSALFTLLFALFLWATFQPGIVLRWYVHSSNPTQARVWRVSEDGHARLLASLSLSPDWRQGTFVDPFVRPGRTYVYRVEFIDQAGHVVWEQTVAERADRIWGYQTIIVVVSLISGWIITRWIIIWQRLPMWPLLS
ncbi:MAG: hypothetical protein Q9O62_03825 [Ardenticatenia bacterium]|nr:hypothetical protein [Ardenticatenia bacterium]